ncbi:hypothetical protein MRBLWH7_000803 [Microbacterium sp. LWH7-1.2]|uniref:hypothetical protein n=1 Tax=Microbacterium sp. LWH7-1.2 TaxID=3135257 RepID=UPI003138F6B8
MNSVRYEFTADVWDPDAEAWLPLPVTNIRPSINKDRVPFTDASLSLGPLLADMVDLLDPRRNSPTVGPTVRWQITQLSASGDVIGRLPADAPARMWPRDITRSLGAAELTLQGGESMIDDKVRIDPIYGATTPSTWAGPNVRSLVEWALEGIFPGRTDNTVTASDELGATALETPSLPAEAVAVGEQYAPVIDYQLTALGCRLYDPWGHGWVVAGRETPPTFDGAPVTVRLSTHTPGDNPHLPSDVLPIVTALEDRISRDSDWADVVVARGVDTWAGATRSWQHTATAAHGTRGRIVEISERRPDFNIAADIANRALRRGRDIAITARARLDILPGMDVELYLREETITALVVSVEWDFDQGAMTIHAQSAVAGTPSLETGESETSARTADAVYDELNSTITALGDGLSGYVDGRIQMHDAAAEREIARGGMWR